MLEPEKFARVSRVGPGLARGRWRRGWFLRRRFELWLAAFLLSACSGEVEQDTDVSPGNAGSSTEGSAPSNASGANTPGSAEPGVVEGSSDAPDQASSSPAGSSGPDPLPTPPDNPAVGPTSFTCDPIVPASSSPLRRLSGVQYRNSVRDIVDRLLDAAAKPANWEQELGALLDELTPDERLKVPQDLHGSYRRLDQRVQQPHVDGWYAAGVNVGQWLTASERFSGLVGECEPSTCLTEFVRRLGRLVLRRPLNEEEVALHSAFYEPSTGVDPAGFADVIAGLFNSPEFLYLVEGRGTPAPDRQGLDELTAHELAARLSYHFWNTTPDEELSALADSGRLLEPAVYAEQVERLFGDDRTRVTLADFYREWLKLEDIQPLDRNNDSPLYQAFAGAHLPSSGLRDAVVDEALALLDYYTFVTPGGVSEVFTTPYSFAQDQELADIYETSTWNGEGSPPDLGDERPGLLTRSALLVTGTANTRPIMRGLFIRTALLCDTIAPPPAAAGATPPELSLELTTREVVEQLTAPAACYGCHEAFINPLGFALEGFDSLGRKRSEQRLFDDEGNEIGVKPIDTASIPRVLLSDVEPSAGAADLVSQLLASGKLDACLTRQYFRFAFGRWEGVARDGCALESMRQRLVNGQALPELLREVAFTEQFRTHTTATENDGQAESSNDGPTE